jgi:hypothetical protein
MLTVHTERTGILRHRTKAFAQQVLYNITGRVVYTSLHKRETWAMYVICPCNIQSTSISRSILKFKNTVIEVLNFIYFSCMKFCMEKDNKHIWKFHSDHTGFTQSLTKMSTKSRKIMFLGSRARPMRRSDNLTIIFESILWIMWDL